MAFSTFFLGLRAKFEASRKTAHAEEKRKRDRAKIKKEAQAILAGAGKGLPKFIDQSLESCAQERVGSWQVLVAESKKHHEDLLESLAYLNREDSASAKTDRLNQDETLIAKHTEELAKEQTAAQITFQQSLQTKIDLWKEKQFRKDQHFPSGEEKHLYEDIAALLKADTILLALQDFETVQNYRDVLTRVYQETLDAVRDSFLQDLEESTYEFERTRKIFEGKETVTYSGFSERFLASDRFLTDQIHRDVLLVQPSAANTSEDGIPTLINRLASPSEGGTIQFGRKWFTLGRGDRRATVDHDTKGLKDDLVQQQDFLFIDQVVNTSEFTCATVAKAAESPDKQADKPPIRKEEVNAAFRALGGYVEGHGDDPIVKTTGADLRFGDNPIRQFLWRWLDQHDARQIAFSLRADGQIRIHVTFCDEKTARKRSDVNHVRLVALFVVTEVNRILNGTSDERVLPDASTRDNKDILIPSVCVWPLEWVCADGTTARDALSGQEPKQHAVKQAQRWMVGYLPLPTGAPDLQHLLMQRFAETSRRHGRVLVEDNDTLRTRFGKGYVPPPKPDHACVQCNEPCLGSALDHDGSDHVCSA